MLTIKHTATLKSSFFFTISSGYFSEIFRMQSIKWYYIIFNTCERTVTEYTKFVHYIFVIGYSGQNVNFVIFVGTRKTLKYQIDFEVS